MSFGQFLKELREKKNLSIRELARRSGVSHPYLSQLETGKHKNPSPETLLKISKGLDVDHTYLMFLAGYLSDTDFTPNKEFKIKETSQKMFIQNNLHNILKSNNDVYYKDRVLTEDEKKKLLTIIEAILD